MGGSGESKRCLLTTPAAYKSERSVCWEGSGTWARGLGMSILTSLTVSGLLLAKTSATAALIMAGTVLSMKDILAMQLCLAPSNSSPLSCAVHHFIPHYWEKFGNESFQNTTLSTLTNNNM